MAVTERLIQTVHAFPVLYNVSLHDYRSAERRVNAWREVAARVGLSVLECKRRWKTIRDRYIRERRLCKLKREEGGRRLHYWPHRESLAFLDAHIRKRKRPSEAAALEELDDVDGSAPDSPEESLDESSGGDSKSSLESKAKCLGWKREGKFVANGAEPKHPLKAAIATQLKPLSPLPLSIVTQLAPVKQLQHMRLVSALPAGLKVSPASGSAPVGTNAAPALLTPSAAPSDLTPEDEPLKAERAFDEDELFLLSYVPALKRLTPQKRAAAKMQIQQIMFDAEFKEP